MSQSMVALVPNALIHPAPGGPSIVAPSWGQADGLCPGERFADQPAAAFCAGVLADWDLVLTAGHCARTLAPGGFSIVFDDYYTAPGQLATPPEIRGVAAIVAEALDPAGSDPRLDYAWLRLDRAVAPPRRPVPTAQPPLALGDPVVFVGTGGGVPLKLDEGGVVRDLRQGSGDYFVADTDTSHGASGGAAFDQRLVLAGTWRADRPTSRQPTPAVT